MDGGSTGGNGRKRSHEDKAEAVREMAKGFRLRAAHGESYLHCSKKVNRAHSTCPPPSLLSPLCYRDGYETRHT